MARRAILAGTAAIAVGLLGLASIPAMASLMPGMTSLGVVVAIAGALFVAGRILFHDHE